MKRLLSLILAGVIGGFIVLGGMQLMDNKTEESLIKQTTYAQNVKKLNVSSRSSETPLDFTEAAERAMPAVVHISASSGGAQNQTEEAPSENPFDFFFRDGFPFGGGDRPMQGTGSGVIYTPDGYIITNNHVVGFADKVEVTLYDNRKFNATVIGTDEKTDLAVIKIDAANLPTLRLADSDQAKVGEWVLAVGNPFDLTSTVTAGIISAKGRSLNILGGGRAIEAFIQTDAAVNPGNSGGALVDAEGRFLGVNTAIATRTGSYSGYSFAIPVNLVTRIADDIVEYGSFRRAYLGIEIFDLDSEAAEDLGVNISQGVVVRNLEDGGSAQYAGVQPMDIIVEVDGKEIKSVPELQEIVGRAKVGETLNITVNRRGELKDIKVVLKEG